MKDTSKSKPLQSPSAQQGKAVKRSAKSKMRIDLYRDMKLPSRTLGRLLIDDVFECFTCEDTVRPNGTKIYGHTAIPAGNYRVVITLSNRFKRELPLLLNVPGFEGIRIHSGNNEGHTEGCILPGKSRSETGVSDSQLATNQLILKIRNAIDQGREVWITIHNN